MSADKIDRRITVLEQQRVADREALKLQAVEYDRRLADLNHAHAREEERNHQTVTVEKFDTVRAGDAKALGLALTRADELIAALGARISALENWKAKATGIGAVLVLFSGLVGAAIMRALGG